MLLQEFDHVLIEEPRLLELAGVSGPVQGLHLAAGDELLELEGAWMGAVFAAREDDHRAIDRLKEFFGGPRRGKLREDSRQVGEGIPFGEERGEIRSQRRSVKARTEILKREIPAVAETVVLVELDMRRHLIGPAITGPADDHRLGLLGPELVHVRHEDRKSTRLNSSHV